MNKEVKKNFDFKIAGVSYKIKSSHDEETVQNLVNYVDQKVSDAMKVTKNASFQNAAVLAALNIAEELILLKKRAYDELEILEVKASKLASKIDSSKVDKINWS
jgi:cell division protein ZapA